MRILLVAPGELGERNKEFFNFYSSLKKLRSLPSLGLCSLSAVLKNAGYECRILDAYAENLTAAEFGRRVKAFAPDAVGVTSTTPYFDMAAKTCAELKKIAPHIPVILGGPHVTVMKKDAMGLATVDYAVRGEGEVSIIPLVEALQGKRPLGEVPNLYYRHEGEIVATAPDDRGIDVNTLPMPDRSDLPLDRYYDALSLHKHAMSMMSTRGCPYRCLFCEEDVRGGKYRQRSVELTIAEMESIVKALGYREIIIYDDTFTANRKRTVELCEQIIRRGLKFTWDCRTRVDRVDYELLALMKRAGCHRISFGVEAGTERVRDILRKNITDTEIRNAFIWCRQLGIRTIGYFMFGTPSETKDEIIRTIEYAKDISPDIAHFCITAPYPGTDLYRIGVEQGYFAPGFWEEYVRNGGVEKPEIPYFVSDSLTREELDGLLKRSYREFYFRPSYILQRLKSLNSFGEFLWNAKLVKELSLMAFG